MKLTICSLASRGSDEILFQKRGMLVDILGNGGFVSDQWSESLLFELDIKAILVIGFKVSADVRLLQLFTLL